jgi:hypothetical protein
VIRDGSLEFWADTQIRAGLLWRDEIVAAIDAADVAILLISEDFYACEFIAKNELPPLLDVAKQKRDLAILMLPTNCSLFEKDPVLRVYQTINAPDLPIEALSSSGEKDKGLRDLARYVGELARVGAR